MKKTIFLTPLIILVLVSLIAATPTPSPPQMIDLGTLGGAGSYGYAINDFGQVSGNSTTADGGSSAFLWKKGNMSAIGEFQVIEMNDLGQIVGHTSTVSDHAVLWQNGELITIDNSLGSMALAINKLGQVAGVRIDESTFDLIGFVWENGTVETLGAIIPQDINIRGQIVGFYQTEAGETHAFLWQNGNLTDLGGLSSNSGASGINTQGWVVGASGDNVSGRHATLWKDNQVIDLGTLGGDYSYATSINDCGQVIGNSETASGQHHAFVWEDGLMQDLGTLGGDYSSAIEINSYGQITGYSGNAEGTPHAFIWTGDMYWLKDNILSCND